jgi:methionine synthase II (cobalamin-independent)
MHFESMTPPFRAEHIGSLLRPQSLIEARHKVGPSLPSSPAQENLIKIQNEAIAAVVSQQLARSIRPITSGEYERKIFYSDFFDRLSGFELRPDIPIDSFRLYFPTVKVLASRGVKSRDGVVCTRKVRHVKSPLLDEWMYLRSLLPKESWKECKITIPSPVYYHMQLKEGLVWENGVYDSDEAFFEDVAAAYRIEFEVLYEAGVRNLQIDDPNLTFFCDEDYLRALEEAGLDARKLLETYVRVHNACLKDLPTDLHIGIHLCRGTFVLVCIHLSLPIPLSYYPRQSQTFNRTMMKTILTGTSGNAPNSTHYGSGSYEAIAQTLLMTLDYSTFYLEFDTDRAGNFQPLRFLPKNKHVVLGLVTTKSPEMEDLGQLVLRVHEAADVIAKGQGEGRTRGQVLEGNLAVSPQCGFSSAMVGGGKGMTEDIMWKKLELVRSLAETIWPHWMA